MIMVDRRILKNFDWSLLFVALVLSLIGVMTIYSATRPVVDVEQQSFYLKQFYWIGISLICFFLIVSIDYRWIARSGYIFFGFGMVLLIIVLIAGRRGLGAQRWLDLGFLSFQPSEFFKIFFVMAFSRYLSDMKQEAILGLKDLLKMGFIFFIIPAVLILKQPDLGTVMILLFVFVSMILTAGVRKKIVVMTIIIGLISVPFVGNVLWGGLKEYQKNRIVAFVNSNVDPRGVGYNINQSKVSIGSGGFFGKGYLKGTQGALRFLPERHTDFIFPVFAEEWGFAVSIVLFIMYLFIILRGFDTARRTRDLPGSFLAIGVTFMFSFYFIINIGMTLGMVPVVGIPLPFISYGGTALLSNFIGLGILTNVRMRRFSLFY